jgi:uncharacterized protein YbjT (DUF2867 family)
MPSEPPREILVTGASGFIGRAVVRALVGRGKHDIAASTMALEASAWFDIPGPEVMTGREILERIGALRGRQIMAIEIPLLTPQLSALWLKLVTRADFAVARELVLGLSEDLLPTDERFWQLIEHTELLPFDEAARRALLSEGQ